MFCKKFKSRHRPYMWCIFGMPWVWGALWQCSGVLDMQIHEGKDKYKDKYTWVPIHFGLCAFNVHGGNLNWNTLTCKTPIAIFLGVRHANTQIQIHIQIRKYNTYTSVLNSGILPWMLKALEPTVLGPNCIESNVHIPVYSIKESSHER